MSRSVYIGFDPREAAAFAVARHSIEVHLNTTRPDDHMPIMGIDLAHLRSAGIYRRPTEIRDGRLWDVISGAPMATEFAVSRFLVKALNRNGWALFMDCDMLVRADINELFDLCDPGMAVMCVKHEHRPAEGTKMDGQVQTTYARKNWSSVFAINCDHPANAALTVDLVNSVPGRDLHRFCWLEDEYIGALPVAWNWLAGHSDPGIDPKIVHHTEGSPCLPGYENTPFADEWRAALRDWARGG
jgi:hypothetical protein